MRVWKAGGCVGPGHALHRPRSCTAFPLLNWKTAVHRASSHDTRPTLPGRAGWLLQRAAHLHQGRRGQMPRAKATDSDARLQRLSKYGARGTAMCTARTHKRCAPRVSCLRACLQGSQRLGHARGVETQLPLEEETEAHPFWANLEVPVHVEGLRCSVLLLTSMPLVANPHHCYCQSVPPTLPSSDRRRRRGVQRVAAPPRLPVRAANGPGPGGSGGPGAAAAQHGGYLHHAALARCVCYLTQP